MHQFEFWGFESFLTEISPDKVNKPDSTNLMKLNKQIFKVMLRSLSMVLFSNQKRENQELDFDANQHHIRHIRLAIEECCFGLLDGFQWHIGHWRDSETNAQFEEVEGWVPEMKNPRLRTILPEQKFKFGQFIPPDCAHFVEIVHAKNFKDLDTRILMTLGNVQYMLKVILPGTKLFVQEKFNLDITLDEQVGFL